MHAQPLPRNGIHQRVRTHTEPHSNTRALARTTPIRATLARIATWPTYARRAVVPALRTPARMSARAPAAAAAMRVQHARAFRNGDMMRVRARAAGRAAP